ncbi:MAG: alanine racemase [Gemmatimonadota bacterium]
MSISRRKFLAGAAAGVVGTGFAKEGVSAKERVSAEEGVSAETSGRESGRNASISEAFQGEATPPDRFDPWVEVDPEALAFNVGVLSRLVNGRPILAVIKNNGYGLDLVTVGKILEALPQVRGLAVVKTEAALALKAAGIRKPVVLMALFGETDGPELVARGVDLCLTTPDAGDRVLAALRGAGAGGPSNTPAAAPTPRLHAYLDTGMSRMGVPYHRAVPWMEEIPRRGLRVESTFMGFTEDPEYDREQLRRFLEVADTLRSRGVDPGILHAASSAAVFNFPASHLDMVRPGISLFGAYPSNEGTEAGIAGLRPALRLRARVVRVEQLRPGDSVSYNRNYIAGRPTWVATLPLGHSDGYPREAVEGARVLINGRLYPPIGAISASHTVVELGDEPAAKIGDVATLVGPDHPEIHPNALAARTGRSVYDILMHLSARMPRVVL